MVQLCVKGTKFPDEFVFECDLKDSIATLTTTITHVQNMRHQVKLQLFSVSELIAAAKKLGPEFASQAARYEATYKELYALSRDAKATITASQFDEYWKTLKDYTVELFPAECVHKDGEEAALNRLWELHENPDIDEDYRLHVYHCRAIMDLHWRGNEKLDEDKTALWFCGKKLDKSSTVGAYCNNNAKSKLTVKVALESGPAPSGEPRMSYDDQRTMRNMVCERREKFKQLEDSELRDRVVKQARGQILLSASGGAMAPGELPVRVTGLKKTSITAPGEAHSDDVAEDE